MHGDYLMEVIEIYNLVKRCVFIFLWYSEPPSPLHEKEQDRRKIYGLDTHSNTGTSKKFVYMFFKFVDYQKFKYSSIYYMHDINISNKPSDKFNINPFVPLLGLIYINKKKNSISPYCYRKNTS